MLPCSVDVGDLHEDDVLTCAPKKGHLDGAGCSACSMQPEGTAPWDPAAQQPQQAQSVQTGQQMMVTGQPVAIPVTQTAGMQAGQPMMTRIKI